MFELTIPTPIENLEQLGNAEARILTLAKGIRRDFTQIGLLMKSIRENMAFTLRNMTWEAYCKNIFGLSKRSCDRLITVSEAALKLVENGATKKLVYPDGDDAPLSQSAITALAKAIDPEGIVSAAKRAGVKLTKEAIDEIIEKRRDDSEVESPPIGEEPEEEAGEVYGEMVDEPGEPLKLDARDPREIEIERIKPLFARCYQHLVDAKKIINQLAQEDYGWYLCVEGNKQQIIRSIDSAKRGVRFATPQGQCPMCGGMACKFCEHGNTDSGWVSEGVYKQLTAGDIEA